MRSRKRQNPKSSRWSWGVPSAAAIAGMVATVAIVAPVRAAVLNNWNFDTATRELTVTLPSGVTPDYFLLAQPARIVLDIPNTTLGSVASAQEYGGAIRSIRLSDVQSGTRIVIEFAPNTRLDPRHAELSSTDVGNGQTQWTLRPLLQDAPPTTVATTSAPPPDTTPPPLPAPAASAPPTAAAVPPRPTPQPAVPPSRPPTPEPELESLPSPEPLAAEAAPTPDLASQDAAPDPEPLPSEEPATPIRVIPAPDVADAIAETTDNLPVLPDIARSATTGAAQALPSNSEAQPGVRTDAAALAGVGEEVSDAPPEQLPIDPFGPAAQSRVSVPPLAAADTPPAPQVAVPSIAEVPDAPTAPAVPDARTVTENVSPAAPTAPTAIAPAQVRPPASGTTATAPSPTTAPAPPSVAAPPAATAAAPPVAANSLEIPAIPLPPDSWRDRANTDPNPAAVRPPSREAIAQAPPPVAAPTAAASTAQPPPGAPATAAQADATASPEPTANDVRPPAIAAPTAPAASLPPPLPSAASSTPASAEILPPPPFLEGPQTPLSSEEPTIPPPPSRPQPGGAVPFGAPLPQSKALDESEAREPTRALSGIPVGTRLALQYAGSEPLVLAEQAPVYEVLTVVGDVYTDRGTLLLPAGTQVLGRFEGFDESGRRFVSQVVIRDGDRLPLLAESDWITGSPQPNGTNIAVGSSIGAAAITLLTGFSGIGLVGGAAVGAAAAAAESPQLVTVEPGQIIEVEVVDDILPFNDAPDITRQYR